jgi:hypothetical protein
VLGPIWLKYQVAIFARIMSTLLAEVAAGARAGDGGRLLSRALAHGLVRRSGSRQLAARSLADPVLPDLPSR